MQLFKSLVKEPPHCLPTHDEYSVIESEQLEREYMISENNNIDIDIDQLRHLIEKKTISLLDLESMIAKKEKGLFSEDCVYIYKEKDQWKFDFIYQVDEETRADDTPQFLWSSQSFDDWFDNPIIKTYFEDQCELNYLDDNFENRFLEYFDLFYSQEILGRRFVECNSEVSTKRKEYDDEFNKYDSLYREREVHIFNESNSLPHLTDENTIYVFKQKSVWCYRFMFQGYLHTEILNKLFSSEREKNYFEQAFENMESQDRMFHLAFFMLFSKKMRKIDKERDVFLSRENYHRLALEVKLENVRLRREKQAMIIKHEMAMNAHEGKAFIQNPQGEATEHASHDEMDQLISDASHGDLGAANGNKTNFSNKNVYLFYKKPNSEELIFGLDFVLSESFNVKDIDPAFLSKAGKQVESQSGLHYCLRVDEKTHQVTARIEKKALKQLHNKHPKRAVDNRLMKTAIEMLMSVLLAPDPPTSITLRGEPCFVAACDCFLDKIACDREKIHIQTKLFVSKDEYTRIKETADHFVGGADFTTAWEASLDKSDGFKALFDQNSSQLVNG